MNYKNLSIILTIVVVILVVAVIYLVMLPQATAPTGNTNLTGNNNLVNNVNSQPNANINNAPAQNQNTNNNNVVDSRQLLTPVKGAAYYNLEQKCVSFNMDQATTQVDYLNTAKGLGLKIPYNPNWGNDQYRINPYDEVTLTGSGDLLLFGRIGASEGCGWVRNFSIKFNPSQTANQVIDNLNNTINQSLFTVKPYLTNINNLNVVKYTDKGLCEDTTYIIIGQKYNYILSSGCLSTAPIMENIIKTMTLID